MLVISEMAYKNQLIKKLVNEGQECCFIETASAIFILK